MPIGILVDKASDQWTEHGAKEGSSRKDHHGSAHTSASFWSCVGTRTETHVATCSFLKTSEIAPPDTDRKADPAKPVKNRKIMCTVTLLAERWVSIPPYTQYSAETHRKRQEN